jgi:SAM-dependent methyltransferase
LTQELGITALKAGDFKAAIAHLEAAALATPGNGVIRYHLAQALRHDGREGDAIIEASEALARDPALNEAARLLTYLLSFLRLRNPGGINPVGLAAAFNFINVDHQVLATPALAFLKQCTPLCDALMVGESQGWAAGAKWLLSSKGRPVLRDPLLLTVLSAAANTDLDIEQLLTALRKILLTTPPEKTFRKAHIQEFTYVLIRQLEINEYVFAVSQEEHQQLEEIFVNPQSVAKGSRVAAESLLLKALYTPLWRLLGEDGKDCETWAVTPKKWGDFICDHISERSQIAKAAEDIECLGSIGDEISLNVARLYEENPYPRWLSLHTPSAKSRRNLLTDYFSNEELAFMDAPCTVLIAGAGTGQQAVDAALGYGPNAALTAIDLSLASLGYGKRMAGLFQVENIHFMQCDILNADLLEGAFDVIESIGVLHHMDDPWLGWKTLVEKLRPGGLMKIGLYSSAARQSIASLRMDIKSSGMGDDEQTIRDYRQNIINLGEDAEAAFLLQSADFFSLSNFRDLMFHVSEQHVTIPEIAAFMAANGIAFHGFEIPLDIADGYPEGDEILDLESWHDFEDNHPETFKGMYVFWCRKNEK